MEDVIEGRGGSDTGLIGQVNEVKPAGVSIGKLLVRGGRRSSGSICTVLWSFRIVLCPIYSIT